MLPVLIAGAGPVGLTAALTLARRGVPVHVIETGPGLAGESRASTFHPPTLEMLADLGVVDELIARGIVSTRFQYRDRSTGPIAELDMEVLSGDTAYPYRVQCEQSRLTPILLDHLLRLPGAMVTFGVPVESAEQCADRVVVNGAVEGSWLIGADGASSVVRHELGVGFDGITYPERFLVVSTQEDLETLMPGIAPINYVYDPVEWMVLLRTPSHWRVLLPTPSDTSDEAELGARHIQDRLRAVADPGRDWDVLHTSLYRVHQRVASSFRVGRILLAGDAAHVNNPLGGMGMNSGIHDAVASAGALASVVDGTAPESVLDDVAETRRDVALSYVRTVTHQNWQNLREVDEAARARHHEELRERAASRDRTRDYLLRTSMIDSLRTVVR